MRFTLLPFAGNVIFTTGFRVSFAGVGVGGTGVLVGTGVFVGVGGTGVSVGGIGVAVGDSGEGGFVTPGGGGGGGRARAVCARPFRIC